MRTSGLLLFAVLSMAAAIGAGYTRAAVVPAPGFACHGSARPMVRLEMLFGTSRPGRPPVSEAEWAAFLDTEVTARFPAGLTVLRGPGQWRSSDGSLARELSNILVIWHEPGSQTEADIEAIRSAYKRRFDQESVMRVESVSCVSF
jgi:hypothetical protein